MYELRVQNHTKAVEEWLYQAHPAKNIVPLAKWDPSSPLAQKEFFFLPDMAAAAYQRDALPSQVEAYHGSIFECFFYFFYS